MLVRLLYASRAASAAQPPEADLLAAILRQSQARNLGCGVTGLLCFSGGVFLQVLEGGRDRVNALYHRIARDPRHTDVVLLAYDEICERRFGGWSMGRVDLARLNPGLVLKYSETTTLDPYALSGRASMALFEDLVATASVAGCA
jgi:hypothetical protein